MAELTGFEGPKCKACGSRNTESRFEDSECMTKCVSCYDCGFDALFSQFTSGSRQWTFHNEAQAKAWKSWEI